jgi:hypothetical protein
MRDEVLIAMLLNCQIFCAVTTRPLNHHRRVVGLQCFTFSVKLGPDDEGKTNLRNVGNYL